MSRFVLSFVLAALAVPVLTAQTPSPAQTPPPANGPITNPMEAQLRSQYAAVKSLLTRMADKMPADAYSFAPTPEMAPFAKRVAHVVSSNYAYCANLSGKPNPQAGVKLEETLTSKSDLQKALTESFSACDEFAKALTAEKLAETYEARGVSREGQPVPVHSARGGLFSHYLSHANEMYGYLSVYLRLKGIVPPSSEPRPARGTGAGGAR